jgi:hypothetical protein
MVKRFFGMINFYKRFVKKAAEIQTDHKPLTFAFQQKSNKAFPRQLDFIG